MHAIEIILNDHEKIRALSAKIKKQQNSFHAAFNEPTLFQQLTAFLIIHEKMEETVLYPNFKDKAELKPVVKHLIEEETKASKALKKLNILDPNSLEFKKGCMKLLEDIDHHAHDEETNLLPKVRQAFTVKQLEDIGKEMLAFKSETKKVLKMKI